MTMPVPMPLTRFCDGVRANRSSVAGPWTVRSLWMLTTASRTRRTTSTTGGRRRPPSRPARPGGGAGVGRVGGGGPGGGAGRGRPLPGGGRAVKQREDSVCAGRGAVMAGTSRREQLEAMVAETPGDPELRYFLAMEYAGAGEQER